MDLLYNGPLFIMNLFQIMLHVNMTKSYFRPLVIMDFLTGPQRSIMTRLDCTMELITVQLYNCIPMFRMTFNTGIHFYIPMCFFIPIQYGFECHPQVSIRANVPEIIIQYRVNFGIMVFIYRCLSEVNYQLVFEVVLFVQENI